MDEVLEKWGDPAAEGALPTPVPMPESPPIPHLGEEDEFTDIQSQSTNLTS